MLKGKSSGNEAQNDYRALGLLMVKLMEPDTSLANPDTLELQNPDEWDSAIKDFLGKTAKSPGKELRKVGSATSWLNVAHANNIG